MLSHELCRHEKITQKKGIIISPKVVGINEGCAMDIQRPNDEELVLKLLKKDVSDSVSITKCNHSLIIANKYLFAPKLTADCIPNQLSSIFRFMGKTTITFVATQSDKVEILYTGE